MMRTTSLSVATRSGSSGWGRRGVDLGLYGRIVVVAGAGVGIGRAVTLEVARGGAAVVIGARDRDSLAETADAARAEGAMAVPVIGDLVTDQEWRQAFEMKVLATIKMIRAARPHLAASDQGRVVVITGSASRTRFPYLLTSTVMNSGLEALVSSLASQFGPDGIAVNAVSPGPVNTRRYQGLVDAVAAHTGLDPASARRHIDESIPAGRITEPEDVARLVAYLVSPAAASVTGATYVIDGGQSR